MNSLYENRNNYMNEVKDMPKPLHMVCPNCNANWLGYLVHEDTCITPEYRYSSKQYLSDLSATIPI